jgi:FtsP/CotA-like multicopper oxidase with cupredoxin domain
VIIVNGKAWPFMKVQRHKYRFRIINASNARFYRLALDDASLEFVQIGADSFYLERPIRMKELLLAPSEIVDVIVDFAASNRSSAVPTNDASYPFPDGDAPNEKNGKIMKFVIGHRVSRDRSRIPSRLVNVTSLGADPSTNSSNSSRATPSDSVGNYTSRDVILSEFETEDEEPTHLLINFRRFSDPVTETPRIGSTEMWRVINLTPDNHPLHVHLTGFQVLHERKLNESSVDELVDCVAAHQSVKDCNLESYFDARVGPQAPPPNEAGFKNVYKMKPFHVTSILLRFALADGRPFPFDATGEPGYAYHCHVSIIIIIIIIIICVLLV